MILTHESGSQEDQFDEKKWRQKISWDYPFKEILLYLMELYLFDFHHILTLIIFILFFICQCYNIIFLTSDYKGSIEL